MKQLSTEDTLAITQLITRYYQSIDALDFGAWADCFTADGRFEGAFQGYAAHQDLNRFRGDSLELIRKWPNLRHHATAPVIDWKDDHVSAESNFLMTTVAPCLEGTEPDSRIVMAGRYLDTIVQTPQGWRFAVRRSMPDGTK